MEKLIINTEHLSFNYSADETTVNRISLQVPKGAIYGFLGHNGAGKSTTIRLLLGLLKPSEGRVFLFNEDIQKNKNFILSRIGSLIESPSLYGHLTAFENLKIAALYQGVSFDRIDEVLKTVGLRDVSQKKARNFSTGMKQRLGIALALLTDPELIILDEPINGLDPKGIMEIRELILHLNKDFGKTIFLSSHLLSEIEKVCTHVGIIQKGKMLYQGKVEDLKTGSRNGLLISIELDDAMKGKSKLENAFIKVTETTQGSLKVLIQDKSEISLIIDHLRKEDLNIYQISTEKHDLENIFLNLTAN